MKITIPYTQVCYMAQRFYEVSRLPMAMSDKFKVVKGLIAVFTELGIEVSPPPESPAEEISDWKASSWR